MNTPTNVPTAIIGPLNETAYHATKAVSSSVLRAFANPFTGPSDAKRLMDGGDDHDSDALRLGSVLHLLLLEPERSGEIVVLDRKPSKADKRRADAFAAFGFNQPRERLSKSVGVDERLELDGAVRAAIEAVKPLTDQAAHQWSEQAVFWTESGLCHKARPDLLLTTESGLLVCIDAKSTAQPLGMWRSHAMRSGLLLQAAHYCEGLLRTVAASYNAKGELVMPAALDGQSLLERVVWLFLVVERRPPHRTRTVAVRGATLRAAMDARYELVADLARRQQANDWADPDEGRILDLCDADEATDRLRLRSRFTPEVEAQTDGE